MVLLVRLLAVVPRLLVVLLVRLLAVVPWLAAPVATVPRRLAAARPVPAVPWLGIVWRLRRPATSAASHGSSRSRRGAVEGPAAAR